MIKFIMLVGFLSLIIGLLFVAGGIGYNSIDMVMHGMMYALIGGISGTLILYWNKD